MACTFYSAAHLIESRHSDADIEKISGLLGLLCFSTRVRGFDPISTSSNDSIVHFVMYHGRILIADRLMRAASRKARESEDKRIEARHIRKITMVRVELRSSQ